MKGTRLTLASALCVWSAAAAIAQPGPPPVSPAVPRADIAASLGWLNVNKTELGSGSHGDWYNRGVHGALSVGWHWSTHLKTEVEASASTRAGVTSSGETTVNGARAFTISEHDFSTRRLTVVQQYQFGENAWFHPHLGAGIDLNWEAASRRDREVYFYDPAARLSSVIRQPFTYPDRTDLHVRPVVAAGFKAYMTRRGFFRSDMRVTGGRRIEEVLVRFGFGVDF